MRQTRGERNHNPGNIEHARGEDGRFDPSRNRWQGMRKTQTDERFVQFATPVDGIRALAITLITYYDKRKAKDGSKIDTIREVIERWAPAGENATGPYIRAVCAALRRRPNDPIDLHDHATLRSVVTAIIRYENGEQPYTDAQIDAALTRAGVPSPAKPLAKTRTVKGGQVAAGAGIVATVSGALAEVAPALPVLSFLRENLPFALMLIGAAVLVGVGWMIYARWDDRRKALR